MSNKTLIVVESPVKAHTIQNYLGNDYIVLASCGHVADLAKGGAHGIGINIEAGFIPKYVLNPDKVEILDQLINAAKECDKILLASDPDREGASIAQHIFWRLFDVGKPIRRMTFNKIDKKNILKALENTIELTDIGFQNQFHSQEARRFLDRIVGFKTSPFLQNYMGKDIKDGNKLSAGRVQSCVTKLIVAKEMEISRHVPETFFNIQVSLSKDNKESFIAKYSKKLTDEKIAKEMYSVLSDKNAEYVVSEVLRQEERKSAPAPLTTSSLQQIMAKMGVSSADTMRASQSLYECGFLSYIRTDSVRMGDDTIEETRQFIVNNNYSIPSKPNIFKNTQDAQDAHECIHVIDLSLIPDKNSAILDSIEKKVYKTVYNFQIASQMNPAIFNTLKITAHVKNNKNAEVKVSGKALKEDEKGFLEVLGTTDDVGKIDIPDLFVNDILYLYGAKPVKLEKKSTQPPPRFSEERLLHEMKVKGIGRPATYSELISKICVRNYVEKKGNIFYPTELGIKVTNILDKYFNFLDVNYTASMEEQLDLIEQGKLNYIDMLKNFYSLFKPELDKAYLDNGGLLCEKCKSPMRTITTKTGNKFMGCSSYPRCNFTKNLEQQPEK